MMTTGLVLAAALTTFTCDNGLQVAIESRPDTRTVFAEIGVRVGSRDEPAGLAGMSHLLEHLLFKEGHGEGARVNPAFSALRASGAEVNASTDFEQTEYHADLPVDRVDEGWGALVSMVTATAFDRDDLRRERGVVLQEVALGKIDPLAVVAYSVLGRIFPGDPIGQPVIGFRKTLHRIRYEDLDRYYRRHYVPANMFALVVGDIDAARAERMVRSTVGLLPGGGAPHPPYPRPEPHAEPVYRFRTLVKQSYLLAGALTDGDVAGDALALDLLARVLGGGRASRLHRRLVQREALTDDVLALPFSVSNTGAFAAGLAVDPAKADLASAALTEEINRLAREPVTLEEIETAKRLFEAELMTRLETNEGFAEFLGHRVLMRQNVEPGDYLKAAFALTPADLLDAAGRHWGSTPPMQIQVVPARGLGKLFAGLRFVIFRRL